jgi:hypothetical protein
VENSPAKNKIIIIIIIIIIINGREEKGMAGN